METPVTWTQLIIACIFILVTTLAPQIYSIYNRKLEAQEKKRNEDNEIKKSVFEAEQKQDDKVWDRVVTEYERAIERGHRLEQENEQLRPLALKNAVLEQKLSQSVEDKEDWKSHALRLEEQLKGVNVIPEPFRRGTHENTQENLKTVSRKMKAVKQEFETNNPETRATDGTPTLIFPVVKRDSEQ